MNNASSPDVPVDPEVLQPRALRLIAELDHEFKARCLEWLARRREAEPGDDPVGHDEARMLFRDAAMSDELPHFVTISAYAPVT